MPESASQQHPQGTDVHVTRPNEINANAGQNQTVYARDAADLLHYLDQQTGVNVGAPPVTLVTITEPPPGPGPIAVGLGVLARRKRRVEGECDPNLNPPAAYVICRILEINVTAHTRTVIAAGADTVKVAGPKRTWAVEVEFTMDTTDPKLQYVARTTAYDKDDKPLGVQTKYFTK